MRRIRLRKQFVIAIPIFLIVTIVSLAIVLTNRRSYSATIDKPSEQASNIVGNNSGANLLTDNRYIKNLGNYIDNRQKDNTIKYYASKFNLDTDKVLAIARKITNDYTNEDFLKTNVIGGSKIIEKVGSFNSFEAGVVYFARDIYRHPKSYGTTDEEIIISDYVNTERNIVDKKIMMSNGMTFEQYYGKIADLYNIDKATALAMVYLESGRMKSRLFVNKNNIGGMRSGGTWLSYPTLEAGIIAHVMTIRSISNKHNFDITDPDGVLKFSGVYVNGSTANPSEKWTSDVLNIREKLIEKNVFAIE